MYGVNADTPLLPIYCFTVTLNNNAKLKIKPLWANRDVYHAQAIKQHLIKFADLLLSHPVFQALKEDTWTEFQRTFCKQHTVCSVFLK